IGGRLRRKQESVHAETRPRTASPAPHRCRAQYAAVLCAVRAAHLVRRVSLIRNWGRIRTDGKVMVQTFDGSAEAVEAFGRLERAKRRRGYAAVDEKLSQSGNFSGITAPPAMPALSVPQP